MGATAVAIADIAKALEIAPDNIACQPQDAGMVEAAATKNAGCLGACRARGDLGRCARPSTFCGKTGNEISSKVTIFADAIEGWAVWEGDAPLTISITDGANSVGTIVRAGRISPSRRIRVRGGFHRRTDEIDSLPVNCVVDGRHRFLFHPNCGQ